MLQLHVPPLFLSHFLTLSLSWPLYLAFSFRVVVSRGSELHGTITVLGTVCQLVERDSNSIGWLDSFAAELASRSVSVLCPRSVVRVPSRSRARQNAGWFLYFYIKCPFHCVRCDTHRLRSSLSTSGASASLLSYLYSFLLSLVFFYDSRSTRNCEMRAT